MPQVKSINMKNSIIILLACVVCFVQCTKDGASESKSFASTGAGGSLARFAIVGNYMYTVDEQQLVVYDLSNPADPQLKNTVNIGLEIETIFPFKDKLFIGSTSAVHIVDISNPIQPKKLSTAISPEVLRRCDPVVARDSVAYATLRTNGFCGGFQSILAVYNIKDVLKPVQVTSLPVTEPYGLGYADSVLYVCDRMQGLELFNISKPFQPTFIKAIRDGVYTDVIVYQNTLICWVSDGVLLYDITNNDKPIFLSKIS